MTVNSPDFTKLLYFISTKVVLMVYMEATNL